jgi:hypothetical protein
VTPGQPLHVRKKNHSITIVMVLATVKDRPGRLVVRCDRDGDLFASIDRTSDARSTPT